MSRQQRKRPVIVFRVEGWPAQDPGRKMLYGVCWKSEADALTRLRRCIRYLGQDAEFEIEHMTAAEARKIANRSFDKLDLTGRKRRGPSKKKQADAT